MKKLFFSVTILLLFIGGCKPKNSGEQEIQKLLDRQALVKESQQESIENLQQLNDTLANEKKLLIQERNRQNEKSNVLENNQQILLEKIKSTEQSELSSEKVGIEEEFNTYSDSIKELENELASLDDDIDSIKKSRELYEIQKGQTEERLNSGITEIDQRITQLENQKQQETKKADLLRRRSIVAEKKIEAYQLERQMYVDQRDDMLRINASDEQLQPYIQRIAEMDNTISDEEANKKAINDELDLTNQWISGVDKMINDLQEEINKEYDRKKIIEGFISSENQRLQMEIDNLQNNRERMVKEQEQITRDLGRSEQQIAAVDKRMELITNKDMSDLLQQQAANEQSDAALAQEEVQLFEESATLDMQLLSSSSDSTNDEFMSLIIMSNQLDSLKASIQEEKTEIAKTRKKLSEKRAEAAEKRARTGSALVTTILIIVIVGLLLLTLFYYLGRKARKS